MVGSCNLAFFKLDSESDGMAIVTAHGFGGKCDNASALVLVEPFQYTILKL